MKISSFWMSGKKTELDICALEGAMHIPKMLSELDKKIRIVVMCHTGV